MKLKSIGMALFLAATPMVLHAAGDAAAGKAKSGMCASCHGPDGKATAPIYPNLAGQNAPYLEMALKAYKAGQRTGGQAGIMTGMTAALSDADIANLAAYYSSL